MAKKRTEIPPDIAARVLFEHDRTCCVCRQKGKPVQIHHLDDDPKNHDPKNLTVLCFDCHRETQIRGGFDRKLDKEQIELYRTDWIRNVVRQRVKEEAMREVDSAPTEYQVKRATSIAEIYRERGEYELLAVHYNVLGNNELRDKYVDLALQQTPTDDDQIIYLRGLQGRIDLIPPDVIDRRLKLYDKEGDDLQKARFLNDLGRFREAARAYVKGIYESLEEGNIFGSAFYLKEMLEEGLQNRLFEIAFREAQIKDDLWWQVRALQELGWDTELRNLLIANADNIEKSGNILLQIELAKAQDNKNKLLELEKTLAKSTTISSVPKDETSDE